MKKSYLTLLFLFVGIINLCSAVALSGTYTVGTGQAYATVTAAVASLNTNGVSSAVTFLLTDAENTSETFPSFSMS